MQASDIGFSNTSKGEGGHPVPRSLRQWVIGSFQFFVTPDLQLALPTHAHFTPPLRNSFTALSLQVMTIGRIGAIVAKSPQLAEFQRSLIDVTGANAQLVAAWLANSIPRSTWSRVPGRLSDPQRAIDGSFYVDFNECGLRPS